MFERVIRALAVPCLLPCLIWSADIRKIEIGVERKTGSMVQRMAPNHVFEQGDLVRFTFKCNFSGYLYVMDESTSGKYLVLFPNQETGVENRVDEGRAYLLPASESGWFRVEGPPGHELLYWLVAPAKLDRSGGVFTIPRPPAPKAANPAITPRCDDTIFRARGECVDAAAGAGKVMDPRDLPENLSGMGRAATRELTVTKSDKKTAVVVAGDEDAPFIYTFRLAHK